MPIPDNQKNYVQLAVLGSITSGGSSVVKTANIFCYRRTSVVNPISKTNIDTQFNTVVVALLALALNNRWTQTFNTVRFLDDADDPETLFAHAAVGAVAGDAMSAESMIYMNYKTAMRGRSNRGNKKFGPLSEADTTAPDSDILNAAAIVRFNNLKANLLTPWVDADGNTWVPAVLSQKLSQLRINPTTVWANDVTTILLNKRISAMDRRKAASAY